MKEFSNYWKALTFAFKNYGDLKRKSGNIPYIVHPIRITSILRAAGFSEFEDEVIMISALFHDLIEDTDMTFEDISNQYGEKVASIVLELSKPENGDKDDWLRAFNKMSHQAQIIKMVDRIDNLSDMDVGSWSIKKRKSYAEQAKIILETCGKAHSELALVLKSVIENILSD